MDTESEYPELLDELVTVLREQLLRHGVSAQQAERVASHTVEHVRSHFGGQQIYIPKGDRYAQATRNEQIYKEFKGNNYRQLATKFGLSEMQVRNIITALRRAERERRQPSLFPTKS